MFEIGFEGNISCWLSKIIILQAYKLVKNVLYIHAYPCILKYNKGNNKVHISAGDGRTAYQVQPYTIIAY